MTAMTALTALTDAMPERRGTAPGFGRARTLDDVADLVGKDDVGKWDRIVPVRTLTLHQGRLLFPEALADGHDAGLELSDWATGQACQRLGIPAPFFKKNPAHLRDALFNHWKGQTELRRTLTKGDEEASQEDWLLRCKGAGVRGVLSKSYSPLDNRQLVEALFPLLKGRPYRVQMAEIQEQSFHLRLVDMNLGRDMLPGDRCFVAVHIANSELGLRAVSVDAAVLRLVCANGLVRKVAGRSLLRQRHLHVDHARFRQLLEEAMREAVVVAAGFLEQVALSVKTPVADPERAIDVLADAWQLPKQVIDYAKFALYGESPQGTAYAVMNALTNAAQRLPVDERFALESLAALVVDPRPESLASARLRERALSAGK
jgi:hypothetical protein